MDVTEILLERIFEAPRRLARQGRAESFDRLEELLATVAHPEELHYG